MRTSLYIIYIILYNHMKDSIYFAALIELRHLTITKSEELMKNREIRVI